METYIEEFLKHLELKGRSPLTTRSYKAYLLAFAAFSKCDAVEITLDMVDRFQSSLAASGIGLQTQSYYLITLRSFLRFLRIRKDLPVLDPLKIELPKTRRKIFDGLTDEEVEKLKKAAPLQDPYDIRARAIIEFLLGSGIRVNELCLLKVSEIDLSQKWFRVLGKGGKERVCFMTDEMVRTVKKYLSNRNNTSAYLFTQYASERYEASKPIATRSIERLINAYGVKAGITKAVYPHMLRRTFATTLLRKDVDIKYIADFLGHDSLQTTSLYTKIQRNDLEKVFRLANKKAAKSVKEDEKVILSRESFQKLTGMVGKTMQNQQKILSKLEKKEEKKEKPMPVIVRTVN